MKNFHNDFVDHANVKGDQYQVEINARVKDGVRLYGIESIVQILQSVLENYQSFDEKIVKDTLNILAQLIDWNELKYFQ